MKPIKEFEEIIRSQKWPDESVVYGPVLTAYIDSKKRNLPLLNFETHSFLKNEEIKLTCESLRKYGINEILFSGNGSDDIEKIGLFSDCGYSPIGCIKIPNPGGIYDPQTAIVLRYDKGMENINNQTEDIIERYRLVLKRSLEKASKKSCDPMSLLDMSEEEKEKMKEIQECLLNIEETVKHLEKHI